MACSILVTAYHVRYAENEREESGSHTSATHIQRGHHQQLHQRWGAEPVLGHGDRNLITCDEDRERIGKGSCCQY